MLTFKQHLALGKQHIFNVVSKHLLTQMEQSRIGKNEVLDFNSTSGLGCRYRNGAGLMCAIGCLISDNEYHPNLEGILVEDLPVAKFLDRETKQFLIRLQWLHDNRTPNVWYEELKEHAKDYKLEFNQ